MNFLYNKFKNRIKVETWDMPVFIYINMRTLRHIRGQEDWESKQWKEHFKDILLTIKDNIVRVDLDDKQLYYLCINYTQIFLVYAWNYACKIINWALYNNYTEGRYYII